MIERHTVTALSYRPDTATISNNGASMHCTTSLNDVSAIAEQLDRLPGGVHPMELVGDSLERWLHGAPSYGSGRTSHGPHLLEDEYVHLGADTLLALSRYLRWAPDSAFFDANAGTIDAVIDQMLAATSTMTGWSSRRSASATRASTSGARLGATCCRSAGRTHGPTPSSTRPGRS